MAITPRGQRYAVQNVVASTGEGRQQSSQAIVSAVSEDIKTDALPVGTVVFFPQFAGTYVGSEGFLLIDSSDIIAVDLGSTSK
jgi:co-chaperonin GroES (HSP10)